MRPAYLAILSTLLLLSSTSAYADWKCAIWSSPRCSFMAACQKVDSEAYCACQWALVEEAVPATDHEIVVDLSKAGYSKDKTQMQIAMAKAGDRFTQVAQRLGTLEPAVRARCGQSQFSAAPPPVVHSKPPASKPNDLPFSHSDTKVMGKLPE